MKKITKEELNRKVAEHRLWIEGNGGFRLDLYNADLRNADFCNANLRNADLRNADLRYANLRNADLRNANLNYADLRYANLRNANLCNADMRYADFGSADFGSADLRNANLRYANLRYANLCNANLDQAEKYRLGVILHETAVGWKKCNNGIIVKLLIPAGAVVFSINGDKCRTNKAVVLDIEGADRAYSTHTYMTYHKGDTLTINDFDLAYNIECSTGIHFFRTKEEAEEY